MTKVTIKNNYTDDEIIYRARTNDVLTAIDRAVKKSFGSDCYALFSNDSTSDVKSGKIVCDDGWIAAHVTIYIG